MNELTDILKGLLTKTIERNIGWTPTDVRNQFHASLGDGSVRMDYFDVEDQMNDPESTIYRLDILNDRGETVAYTAVSDRTDSDFELMANLWRELTDYYYRRSETISSVRTALGI